MPRLIRSKICKQCDKEFKTRERDQIFCSRSCAAIHNNPKGKQSEKTKRKISESLKQYYKDNPDKIRKGSVARKSIIKVTKGKYNKNPKSILEFSRRTVSKICARIGLGCSNCKWNEAKCDIHHIVPKSEGGGDNHSNLAYLCPNCHRLAHLDKLKKENIITLDIYFNNKWLKNYYG